MEYMVAACVPRRSSDNNFPDPESKILISVPLSEAVANLVPWMFNCIQDSLVS